MLQQIPDTVLRQNAPAQITGELTRFVGFEIEAALAAVQITGEFLYIVSRSRILAQGAFQLIQSGLGAIKSELHIFDSSYLLIHTITELILYPNTKRVKIKQNREQAEACSLFFIV